MMRFLMSLLVFCVTTSLAVGARGEAERTAAYYKTKMLCGSTQLNRQLELGRLWLASFSDAGVLPLIHDALADGRFRQLEIGSEFADLTSDPQHFAAVQECFGDDQRQRALFFFSLLAVDLSAKASAWALDLTFMRMLYFGTRAAIAAGSAEMPQRLMWLRVVARLAVKNRTVFRKVADPIILAMLMGALVADRIAEEKVNRQLTLDEWERRDPNIAMLTQDIQALRAALDTATPAQQQVLRFLIGEQLKTIERARSTYRSLRAG